MKTKLYVFRGYKIHLPKHLQVYMGNEDRELLVYAPLPSYPTLAHLSWLAEEQALQVFIHPFVTFEYLALGEGEFALTLSEQW